MAESVNQDSIKVMCRFRPLDDTEERAGSRIIVKYPQEAEDNVSIGGKMYMYDKVFKPDATQEEVYKEATKAIVKDVLVGYNGTIFAYGQTSSGKTYTMEGILGDGMHQGLIPRIIHDMFNHIYSMDEHIEFNIKVSYFEIYLDKIRDLLDVTKTNLSVHEDKNRGTFVKGATERFVTSPDEMMEVINEGKANRHIAVTNMNEHSSRSHSVFLIHVKQESLKNQTKLSGKLYLVDLACSEKVSKSGAEGLVLDEAKNINKSLSALGNVISALADGNKSHIPYRDSTLTRILQESLGGNSRTTIVICCSPASFNESETKSTLEFGRRAKTIKNTVYISKEELTSEEWQQKYEKEIEKVVRYKSQLEVLEAEVERLRNSENASSNEKLSSMKTATDILIPSGTVEMADVISSDILPNNEHPKFEEEITRPNADLDEKDSVISRQSQLIQKLKEQIMELETLYSPVRKEYASFQEEINRLHQEMNRLLQGNQSPKDEVNEVLQALEELASNYDQKSLEVDAKNSECEKLSQELNQRLSQLNTTQDKLKEVEECGLHYRNEVTGMLRNLLKDMGEIRSGLDDTPGFDTIIVDDDDDDDDEKVGEELTFAMLLFNKVKSAVNAISERSSQLKVINKECNNKIETYARDLDACQLLISQHEARMKTLQESIRDIESKKRSLEEEVDSLGIQFTLLTTAVEVQTLGSKEKDGRINFSEEKNKALEQEIEKQRDAHQKQLESLRNEILNKHTMIERLKDTNQKLSIDQEQFQQDYEKLKQDEQDKIQQLQAWTIMNDRREQEIEKERDAHQEKLESLINEILDKQTTIELLKDTNQKLSVTQEQLQQDCEKLKLDDQDKIQKLQTLTIANNRREQEIEKQRDDQQKQLESLRIEISDKQAMIERLKNANQKLTITQEQFQQDYEKLKQVEQDKIQKLHTLTITNDRREQEIEKQRDAHHEQLESLRNEILNKQTMIERLKDTNQKLTITQEQFQQDYEKLKQDEQDKFRNLQKLTIMNNRREQARHDLKGLEETVTKELQILHTLRREFLLNLQAKCKKSAAGENTEDTEGSLAQRQKIAFLESNLNRLTKVHQQLLKENTDLRCELPKLESRLRSTLKKAQALEIALIDAKESAREDRKKCQYEID